MGGFVTACGFQPMYGTASKSPTGQKTHSALSTIDIDVIPDRSGQFLRNELIDRFYKNGYPSSPQYTLKLSPIKQDIVNFDITIDSEATRRQIRLRTNLVLMDEANNSVALKRDLLAITSYNVLTSEYSTLVTEQSAREAALSDLARQIEQQIVLYLNRQ